jgi:undecaprenyl-diphosphatase
LESLLQFDTWLFLLLNGLHADWMDPVMYFISGKLTWIPFYALLLIFVIKKYGIKSLYIIGAIALLVTLCDQISVQGFKNVFERLRPCHNPEIASLVHLVNDHCGGQYGFVSSHATNTFGVAIFMGRMLKSEKNTWAMVLLIWASVVSYSRIYLGVHYPLDVVCGALLGGLIALLTDRILLALDRRFNLQVFSS